MADDVGERLRALRTLRGISQRELAKRCGVTHSSLSLIEQGKVSPSVSSLKKILDAIPMSVGDFFTLELTPGRRVFYAAEELADVGSGDVIYKLVGADRRDRALSFMVETYPPGADTGREIVCRGQQPQGLLRSLRARCALALAGQHPSTPDRPPHGEDHYGGPPANVCGLESPEPG